MNYETENEIREVIENFESCTVARGSWDHPEHLILAFHYLSQYDFETALSKMRGGLFKLLASFEIDLTQEMPYHETITVFWMKTEYNFLKSRSINKLSAPLIQELIEKFDKDYPLEFYTRELLFSDAARAKYIEPDRKGPDVVSHLEDARLRELES